RTPPRLRAPVLPLRPGRRLAARRSLAPPRRAQTGPQPAQDLESRRDRGPAGRRRRRRQRGRPAPDRPGRDGHASGLRVSELLALKVEAVRRDPAYLIVRGKGGKERLAPLNTAAREAIKA